MRGRGETFYKLFFDGWQSPSKNTVLSVKRAAISDMDKDRQDILESIKPSLSTPQGSVSSEFCRCHQPVSEEREREKVMHISKAGPGKMGSSILSSSRASWEQLVDTAEVNP